MSAGRDQAFKDALHNYLSPVVQYLEDPAITEVLINGHEEVFVETKGKLQKTPAKFSSEDELLAGITAIANYVGRRITKGRPAPRRSAARWLADSCGDSPLRPIGSHGGDSQIFPG